MLLEKVIPYSLIKTNFNRFPKMVQLEQTFDNDFIENIEKTIIQELHSLPLPNITGKRIAITAGSRGIPNIKETIITIGKELKLRGAKPFVIPAMGSHGNGTAEGQVEVLKGYGMTNQSLGMPIISSMETVLLGTTEDGVRVYCDKNAYEADGIVVCGRVKPHTDFKGSVESGLCKMMVVGLGKHEGAVAFHKTGSGCMGDRLKSAASLFLQRTKVLFSVAMIDNAYHKTKKIKAILPDEIPFYEPKLLAEARTAMPRILFNDIDVLVVDYYGKEISGAGMDPNITGRFLFAPHLHDPDYPHVKKIVVLRLTEASHGNAAGIGIADYVSHKFADELDLGVTYTNSLSSVLGLAKIPMIMNHDFDTIYAAASSCGKTNIEDAKIIRIRNTLDLDKLWVSDNYLAEATEMKNIRILGTASDMEFDSENNFLDLP